MKQVKGWKVLAGIVKMDKSPGVLEVQGDNLSFY
jgi:hypothetical protein